MSKTDTEIGIVSANAERGSRLLSMITCPHCWERFAPEEVLWISEHVDLLGDPMLGSEQQQRFLPSRFTIEGDAIDARGMTCRTLACPRCHLMIPRGMLEVEPLFISILGAPGSGKSFFLTAMTWALRQLLPREFKTTFTDADPAANRALNDCEEALFLNADDDALIPLGSLIRKTELQGELYDTVAYGQQTVTYPKPFVFVMQPTEGHPGGTDARAARMLCLYDNAGEHFQPGQDTASSPVTRHLSQSRAILFMFDPTQDKRFRAAYRGAASAESSAQQAARLSRQETILNEAATRIRRHAGLSQGMKFERPFIVILSKFDEWSHLLDTGNDGDPWGTQGNLTGVDVERIERVSRRIRELMLQYGPEIVTSAESFAREVIYIPVSALGAHIERDSASGLAEVRPGNIKPRWVTVPLIYAISRNVPALIPRLIRRSKPTSAR